MKSTWGKFKKLPEPLRRVIGLRMVVGGTSMLLSFIMWAITGNFTLAIPFAVLGVFLLIGGVLITHRNFICLTGNIKEIITTGIFKRPKYLLIKTDEGIIQLPINRKYFPVGSSVTLYLAADTPD